MVNPAIRASHSTAFDRLPTISMSEESSSGLDHVAEPQKVPVLNVAVAGATGRVGQLVVKKLVAEGHSVKALVRSVSKATDELPASENIKHQEIDFGSASGDDFAAALADTDAVIWCATGFAEDMTSLDVKAMTELPKAFKEGSSKVPRIIMLSSAGVTRTVWPDEKKEKLVGASDIPIIRMNPGGILDKKREAEVLLRAGGAPYCIVRPTGIKFDDSWPQGRPIVSQGDVAVGRMNAADLAEVLCSVLQEPEAVGKTFEMFTLTGYPAASEGIGHALARLQPDASSAGPDLDESAVNANYMMLQQFLPGENQDATKLEMGRTYEQVDSGEVAPRERGAAPTEREVKIASGVAQSVGGGKRQAVKTFLKNLVSR